MASKIKIVIVFPYAGFISGTKEESAFWDIVNWCKGSDMDCKPLVVINMDTKNRNKTKDFEKKNNNEVDVIYTWSVDTCQMWLAGWGHIIDNCKEAERICLVPGDLTTIANKSDFSGNLQNLLDHERKNIAIGTFETGNPLSSKELIDIYGTRPLLANWFPEVSQGIQKLEPKLTKIRSEFLNVQILTLKKLLEFRKYAYEQTLNMLIKSWNHGKREWSNDIAVFKLGVLKDDTTFRSFRGCIDQIERTERMLKMMWREINEPDPNKFGTTKAEIEKAENEYGNFTDKFEKLDRRSRSIRENARISIRALLVPIEE